MVAGCCWLTPVILADVEAEIRRIPLQAPEWPFHLNVKKMGAMAYTCQLGYGGKHERR
jgi:hypothetical protein